MCEGKDWDKEFERAYKTWAYKKTKLWLDITEFFTGIKERFSYKIKRG